jgi:hypothetical protein
MAREARAAPGWLAITTRLWDSFPSLRFLVPDNGQIVLYDEEGDAPPQLSSPTTLIAWPHAGLDRAIHVLPDQSNIVVVPGGETRGDLDAELYQLYIRYSATPLSGAADEYADPIARWQNGLILHDLAAERTATGWRIWLYWGQARYDDLPVDAFIHLTGGGESAVSQWDGPPGTAFFPPLSWTAGSVIIHSADLTGEGDGLRIGLYDPTSGDRLTVQEARLPQQDNALLVPLAAPFVRAVTLP